MSMIEVWESNINDELLFWRRWCETEGEIWPDDYIFRQNPLNELQSKYLKYINEDSKILDCGSGMFTVLGRNLNGKRLDIICIDALANEFDSIRKDLNLPDIDKILPMKVEDLDRSFGEFDFVHAQNCIDHSIDPVQCFKNMVDTCQNGGYVYTCHEINEGKNENYNGLHKWNFYNNNGFCVSDREANETNLSELFKNHIQEIFVENGWITFIIKK